MRTFNFAQIPSKIANILTHDPGICYPGVRNVSVLITTKHFNFKTSSATEMYATIKYFFYLTTLRKLLVEHFRKGSTEML